MFGKNNECPFCELYKQIMTPMQKLIKLVRSAYSLQTKLPSIRQCSRKAKKLQLHNRTKPAKYKGQKRHAIQILFLFQVSSKKEQKPSPKQNFDKIILFLVVYYLFENRSIVFGF